MNNKTAKITDNNSAFGMHLMLDAYEADQAKLDDMRVIYRFLDKTPEMIGMSKLSTPQVVEAYESDSGKDPGGFSGVVLINESHISIHTFPKRRYFTLDVYSCHGFQKQLRKLMKHIKKTFGHTKEELQIVTRGTKYPPANIV